MSEKIILVSYPDDTLLDGVRIFLYDLEQSQTEIISKSIVSLEFDTNIVIYSVKSSDDIRYSLDKYQKSQICIFNAESENQTMVGFLSAKPNSMYFGNLRCLGEVNDSVINDTELCKRKLERMIIKYGKF
jgi:hypothetical protein